MSDLCKQCNAQLTSADWEAGHCTQCNHRTFWVNLGAGTEAIWNGRNIVLYDGDMLIELTPTEWKALKAFSTIIDGVLEASV